MSLALQRVNHEISKKKVEKIIKKKIINWTYPQIRLDGKFAKNFAAPLHVDKWILHPKKKVIQYGFRSIKMVVLY